MGYELIATANPSGVSSVSISLPSGYDHIRIWANWRPQSSSARLYARIDNRSSSYYQSRWHWDSTLEGEQSDNNDGFIDLERERSAYTSGVKGFLDFNLPNYRDGETDQAYSFKLSAQNDGAYGIGHVKFVYTVTSVQFYFSGTTFSTSTPSTFKVYGLK